MKWQSRLLLATLTLASIAAFQNCGGMQGAGVDVVASSSTGGTLPPPVTAPGVPPSAATSLAVQALTSTQINLTWIGGLNDGSFEIQRAPGNGGPFTQSTGPGAFVTVGSVNGNEVSYTDTTAAASTLYYYQVIAMNGSLAATASPYVSLTTPPAPTTAPTAPTSVTATAAAATVVNISWTAASQIGTDFEVDRSTNGGTTYSVISIGTTMTYQDYNLAPQTSYMYRVKAQNSVGSSTYLMSTAVTTLAATNTNTFTYVNTNIIGPNCASCHNSQTPQSGYNFSSYSSIVSAVSAGNANGSVIYSAMTSDNMPPGAPLTSTQLSQVAAWIDSGAPNN